MSNDSAIRLRISDDELEQYLKSNDKDHIQKSSNNNEVKDFEKRLEMASLSLSDEQKFKPNISFDWIKKLREKIQRVKKLTV